MSGSVADALRTSPRSRWTRYLIVLVLVFVVGLLVAAAAVFGQAIKNHNTVPRTVSHANLLSHSEIAQVAAIAQDSKDAAAAQAQREADAAAAAAAAAALAAEQQQKQTTTHRSSSGEGVTKCPPGTVPGAVDGAGNESNCAPPCQAYDDNNVCTSPGSLVYRIETPEAINA